MTSRRGANAGSDSDLDRCFAALSRRPRRRVLLELTGRDGGLDVAELAGAGEPTERAMATLLHAHLPKLEAAGFVDWDRSDGVVEHGPNFDEIEPLLELLRENQPVLPEAF